MSNWKPITDDDASDTAIDVLNSLSKTLNESGAGVATVTVYDKDEAPLKMLSIAKVGRRRTAAFELNITTGELVWLTK